MPYYIRLFSTKDDGRSLPAIEASLDEDCRIEMLDADETGWRQLLVTAFDGEEICLLERSDAELTLAELAEFIEDLSDARPQSGARWVAGYLQRCTAIYICQFLSGARGDEYSGIPGEVLWSLKQILGTGILHAGAEGFSNENGHHVTWEFADDVDGPWQMAILEDDACWISFEMDLGNEQHRAAFQAGKVPAGLR